MAVKNYLPEVVICGYEHGGTTLLLEILIKSGIYDSGFESGILLCEKPEELTHLPEFSDIIKSGWKISQNDLEYISSSSDHNEMYKRLIERSKFYDKNKKLVDKTPKYMLFLDEVIERNPSAKYLVISRDPRGIIQSWLKRLPNILTIEKGLVSALERYNSYYRGYISAKNKYQKNKILWLRFEDLCSNPRKKIKEICEFLMIPFSNKMLDLAEKRFSDQVHENRISLKFAHEFRNKLPKSIQDQILEMTKVAKIFHYNFPANLIEN